MALAAALCAPLLPGAALAQDFASPWSAADQAAFALLEHALPPPSPGAVLECAVGRWLGTEVETRALAAGAAWRSARFAAGVSQTGDAEIGWSAFALAVGAAREDAGAALRFAGRRDRMPRADGIRMDGGEAGAGAWLCPAPALRLWASAPQLWVDGSSPPLARGLVLGAEAAGAEAFAWIARESAPLGLDDALHASHAVGLGWRGAGLRLALEARDLPLRGAIALSAAVGPLEVAARIESHPVAAETTHLGMRLGWGGAP